MTNTDLPEDQPTLSNSPEPAAEPAAEPVATPAVAPATEPSVETAPAPVAAEVLPAVPAIEEEPEESFADMLLAFERGHSPRATDGQKRLGTVVSITPEQVFVDIGYKTEGVLARSSFENNAEAVQVGDIFPVSVKGRNEERYYELTRHKVAQPRDWSALEAAFADKTADRRHCDRRRQRRTDRRCGRAGLYAREAAAGRAMQRKWKSWSARRSRAAFQARRAGRERCGRSPGGAGRTGAESAQGRFTAIKEGDVLPGTVRTLMPYGAFIDLGGVDGLLHVSDIAWNRISKPEDVLSIGQELQVRILKIDPDTKKISLGLKQLQPEPWETAAERYVAGQRVSGTVSRLTDFGAFVELEAGVEGLIHVSEMAWGKKLRHPSDMLKQGDKVDAVILGVKPEGRRISLGLKQTLTDPWAEAPRNFPAGSHVEGPITKIMAFGAFVQIADGIEGLVHISEISADKRLNHPSDELRVGQVVQAQVLALDTEKRQIKLSMKQLIPTSIDEYIAEHKAGDVVSARVVEAADNFVQVELGEGIRACAGPARLQRLPRPPHPPQTQAAKSISPRSPRCSRTAGKATRLPLPRSPNRSAPVRFAASKSSSSTRKAKRSRLSWRRSRIREKQRLLTKCLSALRKGTLHWRVECARYSLETAPPLQAQAVSARYSKNMAKRQRRIMPNASTKNSAPVCSTERIVSR